MGSVGGGWWLVVTGDCCRQIRRNPYDTQARRRDADGFRIILIRFDSFCSSSFSPSMLFAASPACQSCQFSPSSWFHYSTFSFQ